jgi:hypothetical protein
VRIILTSSTIDQEDTKWFCQQCDKSFYRLDLLKRHGSLSHGAIIQPPKRLRRTESEYNTPDDTSALSLSSASIGASEHVAGCITVEQGTRAATSDSLFAVPASRQDSIDKGPALHEQVEDLEFYSHSTNNGTGLLFSDGSQFVPYMHDSGMQWLFDGFNTIYDENMPPLPDPNEQLAPFNEFLNLGPYRETSFPTAKQAPQELEFNLHSIMFNPPPCNFAICHALQQSQRDQLLWTLRSDLNITDIVDPLLSLNCLQHGLHFYFKSVSPEHSIFHPSLIVYAESKKSEILQCYGEDLSWQLVWAMIILGWLHPSYANEEEEKRVCDMSIRIHESLRTFVLLVSHSRTPSRLPNTYSQKLVSTPRPSLALIQLLFLSLLFARYHGLSDEAAGFAINAHGILIDVHDSPLPRLG